MSSYNLDQVTEPRSQPRALQVPAASLKSIPGKSDHSSAFRMTQTLEWVCL